MTFLTPLFLIGLLAAAIPIAIHLIRREKPPKIIFSTLRFIKTTTKKLVLFQQIQQWLLLLLRSALILLLVMAFARPLFDQSIARMLDAEPEAAVVLFDVSLSMQYGDNFERGKAAVRQILAELSPGDEAALISFASSAVSVSELNTDISQLRSQLDAMTDAGYDTVRFFPALRLANEILDSSPYETKKIYLVSDFQANGLNESDQSWTLSPGVAFTGVDVGESETRNLVLTDVRTPARLIEDSSDYNILARVRSTGSVHVPRAEMLLRIDGETVARETVELTDRSETVVTLPARFEKSGAHTGEVIVSGDDFLVDNSFFFTMDVLPRIRVLIINGDPSPNWFDDESHWLNLALQGMGDSPFEVQTVGVPSFDSAALVQTDIAVLLNAGDLDGGAADAINDYVRAGGKVPFAPGDRVNAEQFNRQFGAIAPAALERPLLLDQTINDYLLIADVDRRHPALRPLELDWNARFEAIWSVTAEPESAVLMRFDNGMPALIERTEGEGMTMLFASALDLKWSNLPLQGLYVPFMHETLRYMVQPVLKQRAYQVGDIIDMSPEIIARTASVALREPDGTVLSLPVDNPFYTPQRPGILNAGAEGEAFYAVNLNPAASELARVLPTLLHDRIINPDTTPQQSTQVRTAQLVAELEQPQRLWWWIIGLVMLLLLVEGYIANRTYR